MYDNLKPRQTVYTQSAGLPCTVENLLGSGGQGEVYRVNLNGKAMALKWYHPHYLAGDPNLWERLHTAIQTGPPSEKFLWPTDLAIAPDAPSFGYLMPLRESRYHGFNHLLNRKIEPKFSALATAGVQLAHSFKQLHSKGLCYRDISFGNIFLDPDTGDIAICDNDNVAVDGEAGGIAGTLGFMAPEIVAGQAEPNTRTDLHSLAVLLFYMLINHHPFHGRREAEIGCLDLAKMNYLYGTDALFIFDPNDRSNEPVPDYQDNALIFWPLYPKFLRDLFTKAFTEGVRDPERRVRESEWRGAMVQLRDSIVYCPACGVDNFYDAVTVKQTGGSLNSCWYCGGNIPIPPRIRIERKIVMLNHDTRLFPHHVNPDRDFDFSSPVATVTRHPTNTNLWGIQNLSKENWVCRTADGSVKTVESGRSISLAPGTKINFGQVEGEIRV
jgi:serine/threonine protein kinase